MSRQISRRYLLFYLSVSAILACGSARRIPREAACPSCDQNYLKVLPAKLLPWNPHQESNRRDSINLPQNSPYSRLMRGRISQNVARDDNVPLAQNYRRFHQQEPYTNKNLFSKNYLNNSPKFLDSQEIISENKPVRGYPPVLPSRQVFDRPENLFFRNPRHKYSEEASLSEVYKGTKGYKKIEEDPMNEVQAVYRDDRDTNSSWKNSRDTFSSNVMQSEKSFPNIENVYQLRREDNLDEERNAIRKSSNSASQLRLTYPQERYTPIGFSPSEIKRDSYVKDADISKSTKEFFDNWDIAKDSLQFSNQGQFRNNLLEIYPAKKQEIIDRDDNEQINSNSYNSKFPQDLNIWGPKKDEKLFDSPTTANARPFENKKDDEDMKKYFDNTERFMNDKDIKEYFEDESEHYMDDKDMKEYFYDDETERFMNDKNVKEYFDDETEQNTFETARSNPRVLPQNIWKGRENEKLDNLDFMRDNSQQTRELDLYSEENNKYFQDEQNEDASFRDRAYANAETARAPAINAYTYPRYLNVVNHEKNSAKSETQELSEAKNNIRANSVKKMDHRFFEDETVVEDNIQDLPKNIYDVEEYGDSINRRNNIRNKNEALTELDPDLVDDIENPPVETTESTLM